MSFNDMAIDRRSQPVRQEWLPFGSATAAGSHYLYRDVSW